MTKVTITNESTVAFGSLKIGNLFADRGGVFIKHTDELAISIHKVSGLMNKGMSEKFASMEMVTRIREATFIIG